MVKDLLLALVLVLVLMLVLGLAYLVVESVLVPLLQLAMVLVWALVTV